MHRAFFYVMKGCPSLFRLRIVTLSENELVAAVVNLPKLRLTSAVTL